ncbi:LON peptidase substrate-binding domain-containing protein [Rheinheimera maricola]|uniref:LON peptidase substrate-binding domain-containing protein n=1 Tax=Rheinheimera maricola TaxID=2793282 RepID=A0ABS7XE36_9GAMM|nr:LON peptidase substrate-binding domain-containing protein [Rheinheimera maricola]MBZ9613596.1 LON peptidase substrate-binding domain-containing protein [Rheinheimera maricola]
MKQLALFPLNSFILPEGRMRLRVFEPRYVRLVTEASAGKRDFAMAQVNPYVSQTHPDRILPLATKVQIEDFEQLDHGLLGITIAGVEKVKIVKRWQEADQLHIADVEQLDSWPDVDLTAEYQPLVQQLQKLLQQYPALQQLYPYPKYSNATWLASRYLEILPMQPALRQQLALQSSPAPCLDSLQAWMSHQA